MATYQYQPLRGPRNIRLILLEPSRSFTEPLHCRIFEVSLDQNPQYEAVSYTWGAHATDKTISCINTPLHITTNCEAALRDLRLPREVRALWVDSICIDQSSDAEKSHQIGLMRDVYALAGEVLVWIGKANRSSDLAMASFSSHSRQMLYPSLEYSRDGRFDLQTTGLKLLANAISWCILMVTVKLVTMFCMRVPSGKKHSAVNQEGTGAIHFSLFARSVFERMWCVQEIAVARRVRVVCGKKSITWEELVSALDYMETTQDILMNSALTPRLLKGRISLQEMLRSIIYPKPNQNIQWPQVSTLLDTTRNRGSTDARDKVYALVGLFQLMGLNLPPPDTSKSVRQVYQEMTLTTLMCDRNLDILYQTTGLPNEHDLPSWVPDLSDTRPPAMLMYSTFNASRSSPAHWRIVENNNGLCLVGKMVDRIKVCGDVLHPINMSQLQQDSHLPSNTDSSAAFTTLKQWLSLAQALPSYPTGQSVHEAFGRTLVTNSAIYCEAPLPRFLDVYAAWHKLLTTAESSDLLLQQGISNMIDDVAALPVTAHEQQAFALQIVSAVLVRVIASLIGTEKRAKAFHHWLYLNLAKKALVVTEKGYMGIAPGSAAPGDAVVLFSGLRTPFLAREVQDGAGVRAWRLVTPAYVEGMMDGALWDENVKLDEFTLF